MSDLTMSNVKNVTMQNETILMISIFQEAYPLDEIRRSPEEYLDHFGFEIDRMGRVLKYLGLARVEAGSGLGWKAESMLMKIIAETVAHPPQKRKCTVTENDWRSVRSLMMHATGDVPEEDSMDATEFCCSVLVALGFLKEGVSGGYKPTDRLQEVMWHSALQPTAEAARAWRDYTGAPY
jgi:hypothetical protein